MAHKSQIPASPGPGFNPPNSGKSPTIPTPLFKPVEKETRPRKA